MWMTKIKLKWFCWEEKVFLGQEKIEYVERFFIIKVLVFFDFHFNFFMKIFINQEHNLLHDCSFWPDAFFENCMSCFSAFVLNLSKSGNVLFISM